MTSINTNPPISKFQDLTYKIQSNTVMNRGLLSTLGFSVPYALNANTKDEAYERIFSQALYMIIAYASPVKLLPYFNTRALKQEGIIDKTAKMPDKAARIIEVSKRHLTGSTEKMTEGILAKGKELGLTDEFKKIINKFSEGKEGLEGLRKALINSHKKVFLMDFLFMSLGVSSIPWITNFFTEKRTGRKGFSGEFKMADKDYTNSQSEHHEKNKYKKMALSYVLSVIPALAIPPYLAKAMKANPDKLKGLQKWLNKNADKFDYQEGKYMSMLTYAVMWFTGDMQSFLIASRDKHELKYKSITFPILGSFFFIGDAMLNSALGRTIEKIVPHAKIMQREGYEKGFKSLFTPMKAIKDLDKKSVKYANWLYWGNMGFTALMLGTILPKVLNKILQQNVTEDIKAKNSNKPLINPFSVDINKRFQEYAKRTVV